MNKATQHTIEVHMHSEDMPQPKLVGTLCAAISRGKEIFSFEYDNDWLKENHTHALDPALQLFSGPQYAPYEQGNFGIFLDSSPDRWGRFLIAEKPNKREQKNVKNVYY